MSARSYLFVPGDQPAMLAKAARRGADALIVDLEDAVAPSAKVAARDTISAHLDDLAAAGAAIWLRVNNQPDLIEGDLGVARHTTVKGVLVPKVDSPADVERAVRILRGFDRADLPIDAMIETGKALLAAEAIAAVPTVCRFTLGLADMGADLAVNAGPDDPMWASIRMQVTVVSAAAGLEPPVAPVNPDFRDLDAFRTHSEVWVASGYGGRQAIHPAQVPVLNDVFAPSPEELTEAHRIVELFDAALAEGRGAITDSDGTMIDEAFVRRARSIIERGGPIG